MILNILLWIISGLSLYIFINLVYKFYNKELTKESICSIILLSITLCFIREVTGKSIIENMKSILF